MKSGRRTTFLWSLGAVIFSLIGVYIALASAGVWYLIGSAVVLLLAGIAFASKAILTTTPNVVEEQGQGLPNPAAAHLDPTAGGDSGRP